MVLQTKSPECISGALTGPGLLNTRARLRYSGGTAERSGGSEMSCGTDMTGAKAH